MLVVCVCADWCGTCRDYRAVFDSLAVPDGRKRWLDIEQDSELLGDIDVDNFPTLVLTNPQGQLCFAGTVMPHRETAQRLIDRAAQGELAVVQAPDWDKLVQRTLAAD